MRAEEEQSEDQDEERVENDIVEVDAALGEGRSSRKLRSISRGIAGLHGSHVRFAERVERKLLVIRAVGSDDLSLAVRIRGDGEGPIRLPGDDRFEEGDGVVELPGGAGEFAPVPECSDRREAKFPCT